MAERLGNWLAGQTVGDRCRQTKLRVSVNEAQQLAANVTAGTKNDCIDARAHQAAAPVTNVAIRSPSAAPFESALIAGRPRRSSICCTPTALSVAGPVTTAGSI